jgi:CxxC motif-containing protein (DUF1111 family)
MRPIIHPLPPRTRRTAVLAILVGGAVAAGVVGCTDALLPPAPADTELLAGPIDGLTGQQRLAHAQGDAEFARHFTVPDGLGPLFIAQSCESCHAGDGKGHPLFDITRFGSTAGGAFDPMAAEGGPQLQNRAILGYLAEALPDGVTAVARFTPPAVTGLGLLEAVDDATILALADPDDADGDGISGRASLVDSSDFIADVVDVAAVAQGAEQTRHVPVDGKYLGRFGKKARTINLLHQTVFAYSEDMGLTSDLVPRDLLNRRMGTFGGDEVADPEVASSVVNSVVFYLRTLRPPPRRNATHPDVVAGGQLFAEIGCASCHTPTLRTGRADVGALDGVEFHPFTDLLLHDMGPELNDGGYTEGDALPSEWRTAPLWGLGLAEIAQGGTPFYLHDGRARTLRDAIQYHGGEAAESRATFDALPPDQQERLLAYLRSL